MTTTIDPGKRRTKTLAILREGRCVVGWARPDTSGENLRAGEVRALVKGHMSTYRVRLTDGRWTCTCLDGGTGDCAHAWAARFVTGWGGA